MRKRKSKNSRAARQTTAPAWANRAMAEWGSGDGTAPVCQHLDSIIDHGPGAAPDGFTAYVWLGLLGCEGCHEAAVGVTLAAGAPVECAGCGRMTALGEDAGVRGWRLPGSALVVVAPLCGGCYASAGAP